MLWAKIYNIIHKKLQLEHMVHEWEPFPSTAKSHEQERTDWKEGGREIESENEQGKLFQISCTVSDH